MPATLRAPAIPRTLPQGEVVKFYADHLKWDRGLLVPSTSIDWAEVNSSIIGRWGVSGLKRIKKAAWKQASTSARNIAASREREA